MCILQKYEGQSKYFTAYEYTVILQKLRVFTQEFLQWDELGVAVAHIARLIRTVEIVQLRVRPDILKYVMTTFTVDEAEVNLPLERPLQYLVVRTTHDHKVDGQIVLVVVTGWVHTQAELVASLVGEEGWAVQDRFCRFSRLCLCDFLVYLVQSPCELTVTRIECVSQCLLLLLLLRQSKRELLYLFLKLDDRLRQTQSSLRRARHEMGAQLLSFHQFTAPKRSHFAGHRLVGTVIAVMRVFVFARDFAGWAIVAAHDGIFRAGCVVQRKVRKTKLSVTKFARKLALGAYSLVRRKVLFLMRGTAQRAEYIHEVARLEMRRFIGQFSNPRAPRCVFRTLDS